MHIFKGVLRCITKEKIFMYKDIYDYAMKATSDGGNTSIDVDIHFDSLI